MGSCQMGGVLAMLTPLKLAISERGGSDSSMAGME